MRVFILTRAALQMLLFCPLCGGLLLVSNSHSHSSNASSAFKCRTCAYSFPVPEGVAYASRVELKRKTVDDVLGGEDAWKNVDSTDGKFLLEVKNLAKHFLLTSPLATCPKCENGRAYFMQIQIRSADEPSSIFYKCCKMECGHQWREG